MRIGWPKADIAKRIAQYATRAGKLVEERNIDFRIVAAAVIADIPGADTVSGRTGDYFQQ